VPVVRPAGAPPFSGAFSIRATLDSSGRVAEVRTSSSLSEAAVPYIRAAMESVRQWQYDPPADAPISFSIAVTVPQSGDLVAMQAVDGRDPIRFSVGGRAGRSSGAVGGVVGVSSADRPGVTPGSVAPPAPGAPVRVGGAVLQPTMTWHVNPEYPAIGQSARVQGVVILEAVIGDDGRVQDTRVLRSIPLLDQAAVDAVRQWEFTPTMLNGQPVPVIMTVTVQFTLPEQP
jgi:protein TonB